MDDKPDHSGAGDVKMPLLAHLIELRSCLLKALVGILVVFLLLMPFANEIYSLLAGPLLSHMPANSSMIAIDVASPFLTPFKLTLVLAIFLAMPWLFYQAWSFVAPGLYPREQRLMLPLLVASSALFYLGVVFCYLVVLPLVFAFLTATAPTGVAVMTDISRYLDFVLTLFFAFGISFEVPIVTIGLVWARLVTPEWLADKRPYVIVAAFVFGMLLTPPDAISQTLLAVPVWMLFEMGLLLSRLLVRNDLLRSGG